MVTEHQEELLEKLTTTLTSAKDIQDAGKALTDHPGYPRARDLAIARMAQAYIPISYICRAFKMDVREVRATYQRLANYVDRSEA